MSELQEFLSQVASFVWWPVLFLIIGGGLFFLFHSGFVQYKFFGHTIQLIRGKYDDKDAPGQISAYKALSTALASTVGMGNLAGVAAAIALGGPGALFWMWVTALIGMSTNFYTSTLAILFRGKDSVGEVQGGPMYVIREGLGKKWVPFANFFCICCMVGCLPIFQANQLTQALIDIGLRPLGFSETFVGDTSISSHKLIIGITITILAAIVIIGGIQRIGNWAGRMVPAMIVLHFLSVVIILFNYADRLPYYLRLIFVEAFSPSYYHGDPFLGGILGGIIMLGVRRATFSNEAGLGTSPMAMGASKSNQPVREGLVSMLSPAIDTLLSCSFTALAILVTDVWQTGNANGITLTALAFRKGIPGGDLILLVCVFFFALSSLFSYSYYGRKALAFIVGVKESRWYDYFYILTIVIGAIVSMDIVLNLIDIAFALMAVPTMVSGFLLASRVKEAARHYFSSMKK